VACRSELVTANVADWIRVFRLTRPRICRIDIDATAQLADQTGDRVENAACD
jgi:hypothetical protein